MKFDCSYDIVYSYVAVVYIGMHLHVQLKHIPRTSGISHGSLPCDQHQDYKK